MKIFFVRIFLILSILISNCVFSQWVVQYQHPTSIRFLDICFSDSNTGYATSEGGGIFKTTNKGINWSIIFSNPSVYAKIIEFDTNNIGYALGNKLLKTQNGGLNWTQLNIPSGYSHVNDIEFIDVNTGFIGGEIQYMYKTTNGGLTWTKPETFNDKIHTMQFVNRSYGIVSTDFGYDNNSGPPYFFYVTWDTGYTWTRYKLNFTLFPIFSISFINEDVGYVTDGALIWKTTEGYKNFYYVYGSFQFYDLFATSQDTVYVVGVFGKIAKTVNGGLTWYIQNTGISSHLYTVYFLNNNTGYAVGDSGRILYTTNGGEVGIKKISEIIPEKFTLNQNYPNPFNSSTIIDFTIPFKGKVKLFVYDILGKEVAVPVDEELNPGSYSVDFEANNLTSGIYFYRLQTKNYSETKRMIILK